MNENQFNPQSGYQQNQTLQDKLTDNQTHSGNNRQEESENRDKNTRTQQHDYKSPSAYQNEDEADTDEGIFDQYDENNPSPVDELSTELSDKLHIWTLVA